MTEDTDKEDEQFPAMENRLRQAIANNNAYHSGAPDVEDFELWLEEFEERMRKQLLGDVIDFYPRGCKPVPVALDGFEKWLESHDANVRAETLEDVMHDRVADLTPAELIQCAWDAAYPVPEGRTIPAGTPTVMKYKDGTIMWNVMGPTYEIEFIETDRIRTLEPLPPVIPDGTPAVWASTSDGIRVRRILVNTDHITRQWIDMYDTTYADADLIDPVPIPKEES